MPIDATPADRASSTVERLDALREMLVFVARGGVPSRQTAVDYIACRSSLLASAISEMLPGFLYQCGTIDRFKDFIFLYDPDPEFRREFLDRMITRARTLCTPEPAREPTRPLPAKPSVWEF